MRKAVMTIDQHTKVPLGWVAAGMALVFSLLPSLVTMRMLDERTKGLPETLKDHETRIVILETRQGMSAAVRGPVPMAKAEEQEQPVQQASSTLERSAGTTDPIADAFDTLDWTGGIASQFISALTP